MPNTIDPSPTSIRSRRRSRRNPAEEIAELEAQVAKLKASGSSPKAKQRATPRRTASPRTDAAVPATPSTRLASSTDNDPAPLRAQIRSCIDSFAEEIVDLVNRAMLEAVQLALGGARDPTSNEPPLGDGWSLPRLESAPSRRASSASGARSRSSRSPRTPGSAEIPSFDRYQRMALQRAIAEAGGNVLEGAKLLGVPRSSMQRYTRKFGLRSAKRGGRVVVAPDDPVVGTSDPLSFESYEKAAIVRALGLCNGDMRAASRMLKVGKSTLYRRMEVLGIPRTGGGP